MRTFTLTRSPSHHYTHTHTHHTHTHTHTRTTTTHNPPPTTNHQPPPTAHHPPGYFPLTLVEVYDDVLGEGLVNAHTQRTYPLTNKHTNTITHIEQTLFASRVANVFSAPVRTRAHTELPGNFARVCLFLRNNTWSCPCFFFFADPDA